MQCVIIDPEGLLQHLLQPFLDLSYHMLIEIHAEENRKFIAADAEYIVIFTNAQQEALRRFLQELIPHRMPVGIIDGLEPIQIQIHQHERQLLFLFVLQHHREIALIEKSGQPIGIR